MRGTILNNCKLCGGFSKSLITFKHIWYWCNSCGNVFRENKIDYPLDTIQKFIPSPIRNKMKLFFHPEVQEAGNEVHYQYYSEMGKFDNAEGTKWKNEWKEISSFLDDNQVLWKNKTILHISGGPGFLAKESQRFAARVVVTEFSSVVVNYMVKEMSLNALRFDYESDSLEDVVSEKFDIILIPYSINFCTDLKKIANSLRGIINPNGSLFISFTEPSVGVCLRFQWEEYPYKYLYTAETIKEVFSAVGFKFKNSRKTSYSYDSQWGVNIFKKILLSSISEGYFFRNRKINSDRNQSSISILMSAL